MTADFSWTSDLLAHSLAAVDWALHQQIVMVILVAGCLVSLVQYGMGA